MAARARARVGDEHERDTSMHTSSVVMTGESTTRVPPPTGKCQSVVKERAAPMLTSWPYCDAQNDAESRSDGALTELTIARAETNTTKHAPTHSVIDALRLLRFVALNSL